MSNLPPPPSSQRGDGAGGQTLPRSRHGSAGRGGGRGSLCFVPPPPLPPGTLAGAVPGSAFGRPGACQLWCVGNGAASLLPGVGCLLSPAPGVPLCPPPGMPLFPPKTLHLHSPWPQPGALGRAWGPTHCQTDELPAKPGRHPALPPLPAPLLTSPPLPRSLLCQFLQRGPQKDMYTAKTCLAPGWRRAGLGCRRGGAQRDGAGGGRAGVPVGPWSSSYCISACGCARSGVMQRGMQPGQWGDAPGRCSRAESSRAWLDGHHDRRGSGQRCLAPRGRAGRARHRAAPSLLTPLPSPLRAHILGRTPLPPYTFSPPPPAPRSPVSVSSHFPAARPCWDVKNVIYREITCPYLPFTATLRTTYL